MHYIILAIQYKRTMNDNGDGRRRQEKRSSSSLQHLHSIQSIRPTLLNTHQRLHVMRVVWRRFVSIQRFVDYMHECVPFFGLQAYQFIYLRTYKGSHSMWWHNNLSHYVFISTIIIDKENIQVRNRYYLSHFYMVLLASWFRFLVCSASQLLLPADNSPLEKNHVMARNAFRMNDPSIWETCSTLRFSGTC